MLCCRCGCGGCELSEGAGERGRLNCIILITAVLSHRDAYIKPTVRGGRALDKEACVIKAAALQETLVIFVFFYKTSRGRYNVKREGKKALHIYCDWVISVWEAHVNYSWSSPWTYKERSSRLHDCCSCVDLLTLFVRAARCVHCTVKSPDHVSK